MRKSGAIALDPNGNVTDQTYAHKKSILSVPGVCLDRLSISETKPHITIGMINGNFRLAGGPMLDFDSDYC